MSACPMFWGTGKVIALVGTPADVADRIRQLYGQDAGVPSSHEVPCRSDELHAWFHDDHSTVPTDMSMPCESPPSTPCEARGSLAMHCWRPHPSSGTASKSRRTLVCPLCGLLREVFKSPTPSPVAKRSRPASTRSPSPVVKHPCCLPPRRFAPPTEELVEPEDVDRGSSARARAPPTTFPGARAPPCLMSVCPLSCKECDAKLKDVDRGSPARARIPPTMFPGARAPGRHRPQGP